MSRHLGLGKEHYLGKPRSGGGRGKHAGKNFAAHQRTALIVDEQVTGGPPLSAFDPRVVEFISQQVSRDGIIRLH